jgi:exosome complex component RRP4
MNKENDKMSREVVLPGDLLDSGNLKAGSGVYSQDGKIYAAQLGIKSVKSNFINVIPLAGRYIPIREIP